MALLDSPPTPRDAFDSPPWQSWLFKLWQRVGRTPQSTATGSLVLSAGTATVDTPIAASSHVFFTVTHAVNPGVLSVTRTVGSSFTVTSSSGSDASTVAYLVIEP